MIWHASNPECRVSFYPQAARNLGVPSTILVSTGGTKDDLIAVTTSKDLRRPAGSFGVVLAPHPLNDGSAYLDILKPGDLVLIEMGPDRPQPKSGYTRLAAERGYGGLEAVMLGSIDEVRYTTQINPTDGRPDRAITISGRDVAKYLVDDQIWWDSWTETAKAIIGLGPEFDEWLRLKSDGGKPAGLIHFLMNFMQKKFDVTFAQDETTDLRLFRDLFRFALTLDSPSVASPWGLESFQGAPWALMERVASPPLFVLGVDMRRSMDIDLLLGHPGGVVNSDKKKLWNVTGKWDSQPTLFLYRNPWPNRDYQNDWANLPTRVLHDSDLISFDLGRGIDEVSNTWRVWSESQGKFKTQGGGGQLEGRLLRDFDSVQRYGNRPLFITTSFISGLGSVTQKNIVSTYSFRLKDWNRWNEWFLNGRITMKGMAQIKVGDRLWHWDKQFGNIGDTEDTFDGGVDYYVEAVTQDFRAFSGWTTSVQVTRGMKHMEPGASLSFKDIDMTDADLADQDSAARLALRQLSDQVKVWGEGK